MGLYFSESQVPELKPLVPALRRHVLRQALALARWDSKLVAWLSTIFCVLGGLMGPLIAAFVFAYLFPGDARTVDQQTIVRVIGSFGSVGVGAGLAGYLGLHLQFWKLRPYLRKAIAECEFEKSHPTAQS